MINIDKIIKKDLKKKNKSKLFLNNPLFNVTLDMEFAKWLSYENNDENERRKYLLSLNIEELTKDQIEELKIYNNEKIYSRLFNKYAYNIEELSDEEYIEVCNYMNTHSIEDLMNSKLNKDELIILRDKIVELYASLNKNDLYNYLINYNTLNDINSYKNMSIYDSFIFHYLANVYIENNITNINQIMNNDSKIYVFNNLKSKAN